MLSFTNNFLSDEIIKKYILCAYSLQFSQIEQIKFKNTDKQRAVFKVSTDSNCYCLKKVYYNKSELLFIYSVIEWLSRFGLKVPRFLCTKENGRFSQYEEKLFILTPWIEGEKCNYDKFDHILLSTKNLAIMHLYGKNFFSIKEDFIRIGFDNIYTSTNKHFYELLAFNNSAYKLKDDFSIIYIEYFSINIKLANMCTEISSSIDFNNLSKSICHLDYVNKNIIIAEDNQLWTIDFDKCKLDYCVHDFSYYLRRLLKRESTRWDFQIFKKCLYKYEQFKPLNLDEYKYIFSYLCFPQKYWKISRDYFNNVYNIKKTSFIPLINKATKNSSLQLEFAYEFLDLIENKFAVK